MATHIEKTVIDCPNPQELATFYSKVLDKPIIRDDGDWVVIGAEDDSGLAFQRVDGYRPPQWPSQEHPQQLHLDIRVDDINSEESRVLGLGATLQDKKTEEGFHVFLDPAGHPFCLVFSQ
jgi:predicted enzyme related to lactoylglutathione lyase